MLNFSKQIHEVVFVKQTSINEDATNNSTGGPVSPSSSTADLKSYPLLGKRNYSSMSTIVSEDSSKYKSSFSWSEITEWKERWFLSSNAKDIGTLYLIFALFAGLAGTSFSVLIRLELSGPGVQYIADNQLYNSIITAHAIVMIFFMEKKLNHIFLVYFLFYRYNNWTNHS